MPTTCGIETVNTVSMIMLSKNFLRQQRKSEMSETNVVTIAVL